MRKIASRFEDDHLLSVLQKGELSWREQKPPVQDRFLRGKTDCLHDLRTFSKLLALMKPLLFLQIFSLSLHKVTVFKI